MYSASGIAGLAISPRRTLGRSLVCLLAALGSLFEAVAAIQGIIHGGDTTVSMPSGVFLFEYSFRLDPLSAYFLLALASVGLAVSIYSYGYLEGFGKEKPIGVFSFFYCLLLISLTLVFTASNAVVFLIAWELMALAAYFLVTFDHENDEAKRAGSLFFVMSHAGTGALLIAFLLMGTWAGSFDFAAFRVLAKDLSTVRQGSLFLLFLLGFGIKAGMVPVHIWLPVAHPAAPSNVSAVMSSVLIKTGIYGLMRISFEFMGSTPLWPGMLLLGLGIVSALIGVLYALIDPDLKRMLAYSTIENSGIILLTLGAALVFRSYGRSELASVALAAGLLHILNHAIFKSLLFLSAGAVVHATGTRNMERLGGLIRPMPWTALFFLIGAIAISGLPPLNGFVSEWLAYQSLLGGFGSTTSLTRVVFPVAGSLLALTGALAAACFVRAFGVGFLALARREPTAEAHEATTTMLTGMAILAILCVALGLGVTAWLPILDPVTGQLLGNQISTKLAQPWGVLSPGSLNGGTVAPTAIACLLVIIGLLSSIVAIRRRKLPRVTRPTWDCGLPGLDEGNEYTAIAFSKPLRMVFATFYQPRREIHTEFAVSAYFPKSVRFETGVEPAFESRLYSPLVEKILERAHRLRTIQAGSIHAYLAYIFLTLVALLLFGVRA
jgi:hydrogenase-4 component B